MADPLLAWKRPLTSAEREADLVCDLDLSTAFRVAGASWSPVLPEEVPRCRVCTLPNRDGLCRSCRRLLQHHGKPLSSLEFVAIVDKRHTPERLIWDWKEEWTANGAVGGSYGWLAGIAERLSAYAEAHSDRLLAGAPVVTTVPSRAPLIATSFDMARKRGWFSLQVTASGRKNGGWFQHKMRGQDERLARTTRDWVVDGDSLAGRGVLLLDDVFVSGASLFSYAAALREAGAADVRAIAVGRHVDDRHWDYFDAARIVRRTQDFDWSADRASVARFCPRMNAQLGY